MPFTQTKIIGGGIVLAGVVMMFLYSDAVQVSPDASEPVARETPKGLLVTEALDTQYARPEPAPQDTLTWRGLYSACHARLCQQYDDCQWKRVMAVAE